MTKVTVAALLLVLAATASGARAQAPDTTSAAWVVEMFYGRPAFPGLAEHVTGEFAEHYAGAATVGAGLPPEVVVTSRPLRQEAERATFATHLRDASHARDFYTFLRRENGVWKISEVRTLALPPLHDALLQELEGLRSRRELPDSMVAELENMRLTAASDSALKAHLLAHEPAFRALAERFAAARGLTALSTERTATGSAPATETRELRAGLRALRLGGLERRPKAPGCVLIVIGGMLDNEVGYIFAPPGCTPPAVSPSAYIYVEQVAPGWYLYKTT